jgi:hypothetical protein
MALTLSGSSGITRHDAGFDPNHCNIIETRDG